MASLKVMVMMVAMVMVAEAQVTSNTTVTAHAPVTADTLVIIIYKSDLSRPLGASYSDACVAPEWTLAIIAYKFNLTRPSGASSSDACEPYPTDTTIPPTLVTTTTRPTTTTQSSALGIGVGVGVGAGVLLILVITLSVCYCKRRNEPHALQKRQNTSATEDPSRYIPSPVGRGQLPSDELPGIKFQREAMKDNADGIYEELDDEGRAQKTEPHYLNYKAQVQHSASPYECPDSQLNSATTKPGVESPYVDLTV
ncbi:uncharacterized protein LOC133359651 isoform X2 [Lethenteron reissneri]|uniref:uncharacterized protein LOC133359651 isoform X2 n=1 Tax=Lethenteron reissneri TaxID=7753 RepID=UPI002AB65A6E|nr:uncharacterized protein LOC133359651 isoform X2 [Lethenteron reissneri]